MKEVLVLIRGGTVKIFAEGAHGIGTETFTKSLADSLGTITERHIGHHPAGVENHDHGHIHAEDILAAHRRGE